MLYTSLWTNGQLDTLGLDLGLDLTVKSLLPTSTKYQCGGLKNTAALSNGRSVFDRCASSKIAV